jgi:hypothetical protein
MYLDTTIISALIATFTAIVISIISNHLNKRSTLRFEERKLKQQYYIEYIQALSENMNNLDSDEATIRSNHAFNNLIVVASSKVIVALYEYNDLQIKHLKYNSVENYPEKFIRALTKIVQAMRSDLYGNRKRINDNLPDIYFLSGVLKVKGGPANDG